MRHTLMAATLAGLVIGVGYGTGASQAAPPKSDSKVKATATADKAGADGKQVITVKLAIDPGWHIYANPCGDSGTPTVVTIEGKKSDQYKVEYPPGKSVTEKDVGTFAIYEDNAAIKVTVHRTQGDSPLKLKVKLQACDQNACLVPATVELSVR
jgi:DsbC/DsbD-like thiol-disulfide interchange protein